MPVYGSKAKNTPKQTGLDFFLDLYRIAKNIDRLHKKGPRCAPSFLQGEPVAKKAQSLFVGSAVFFLPQVGRASAVTSG